MRFFERLRTALSRYGEGVHLVGEPASRAALAAAEARLGVALPEPYRELLLQWNGALLFHEALLLRGVEGAPAAIAQIERADEAMRRRGATLAIGHDERALLYLDARGRVLALDEDTERVTVIGSALDRWLDATLAREALLFDRDGEFRDGIFDGDELVPAVARRRAEAGVKADPDAATWHVELALARLDAGQTDAAATALERATAIDPAAADAWLLLGRLRRASGALDDAEAAYLAAARAGDGSGDDSATATATATAGAPRAAREGASARGGSPDDVSPPDAPEESAFAFALAAAVAKEAGREPDRARHAAAALGRMPDFVEQQKAAATHLLDARDLDGAAERLELVRAVAPCDPDLPRLDARARSARSLVPL